MLDAKYEGTQLTVAFVVAAPLARWRLVGGRRCTGHPELRAELYGETLAGLEHVDPVVEADREGPAAPEQQPAQRRVAAGSSPPNSSKT